MQKQQNSVLRRTNIQNSRSSENKRSVNGTSKNLQTQGNVSLYHPNRQINDFLIVMNTQRLLEASNVFCKIIFSTPGTKMETVKVCNASIKRHLGLKTKEENTNENTLEKVLLKLFIQRLSERFMYKKRLNDLLKDRQIPFEKKQKWLKRQYEIQGRLLQETDSRSISFLEEIFMRSALFVYEVLKSLFTLCLSSDEDLNPIYDYINAVLERTEPGIFECCNKEVVKCLLDLKQFAEENHKLPNQTRASFSKHAKFITEFLEKMDFRLKLRHKFYRSLALIKKK